MQHSAEGMLNKLPATGFAWGSPGVASGFHLACLSNSVGSAAGEHRAGPPVPSSLEGQFEDAVNSEEIHRAAVFFPTRLSAGESKLGKAEHSPLLVFRPLPLEPGTDRWD